MSRSSVKIFVNINFDIASLKNTKEDNTVIMPIKSVRLGSPSLSDMFGSLLVIRAVDSYQPQCIIVGLKNHFFP
jgi:hypothetical protein